MLDRESIRRDLARIVREVNPEKAVTVDEIWDSDYLGMQIMDSFGVIEFISKIEEHFSIKFSVDDLESPKFRTLGTVADLVMEKTAAS